MGKALVKLFCEMRDAPRGLQRLAYQVLSLHSTLDQQLRFLDNHGSETSGTETILFEEDVAALEDALQHAKVCLGALEKSMLDFKDHSNTKRHLQWVFRDRDPVLKLLGHVRQIEQSLMTRLVAISRLVYQSCFVRRKIAFRNYIAYSAQMGHVGGDNTHNDC